MKLSRSLTAAALSAGLALTVSAPLAQAAGEVNIYSYRQEVLIRPLLTRFSKETGIKVNVVFAKSGMIARLKAEGPNSPADVILTVDAARLIRAKEAGVLQPVTSEALSAAIPAQYRDPQGYWFGMTVRGRPIIYAVGRVKPSELSTYEALAQPKWKGRICIRSSSHVYNQSMLASMIAHNGVAKTEAWAKGFVANFARTPKGGDRDQIRAVAAGLCDIAIANTYYLAGMTNAKRASDRQAARKVKVFWPNQNGRGTHVNISGGGVTKSSKNRANAIKLLEFLASDEAQRIYADKVLEYPVKPGIPVAEVLEGWGRFKADQLNLAELAKYNADAVKLADRAGWR
jgi:iron(III) transport system substrate-binding protein